MSAPPSPLKTGTLRIEALSDGVFAIVMTLLIFDIKPPPDSRAGDLGMALLQMWPSFAVFVASFGLLGIYWSGHQALFQYIRAGDHNLRWLNILILALVSMLPFSARLLIEHPQEPVALWFFGANLIFIGLVNYALLAYAMSNADLATPDVCPAVIRFATARCLMAPACYVVALVLTFVSPICTLVLYAAVPLLYILPPVQRYWMGQLCKDMMPPERVAEETEA